jgi:thioesterase domain-containing protein
VPFLAASHGGLSALLTLQCLPLRPPVQDRTPFPELVAIVADFLRQEVPTHPPTRPVYLLGESFGGLLALAVAAGEGRCTPWGGAN